jgi:23S rRNA pseudouridine2605 synthase
VALCSDTLLTLSHFVFAYSTTINSNIYSYDTSGLLLFSSSGPLTQTLLHPKHSVSKEYVAVVTGRVDEAILREQFTAGVVTGTGNHTADLVSVHHWETGEVVEGTAAASSDENADDSTTTTATAHESVRQFLADIKAEFPPEYNQTDLKVRGYLDVFDATELSTVTLTVTEGKHRMVRRMLANCGHAVVALTRERLGGITLGDLPVGTSRPLTAEENKWAEKQLGSQKKSSKPYKAKAKTSASATTGTAKATTTKTRTNKH